MGKKVKILFLGDLGGGGKERRMSELIRYLRDKGQYELYLMLNAATPNDYPQTLNYVDGYKEIDFTRGLLSILKQVRMYIKEIKPDIIHSWHEYLSLYIDVQKPLLPNFYYIAGFVADANKDDFLRGLADKLTYTISDIVISNSKAGLVAHEAPTKKSIVIYNGFNEDRIPAEIDKNEIQRSLGLNGEKLVAMAGRMQTGKDYNTFLDAIKILNQTISNVKYLLIGQGEYLDLYKKRVVEENIANVVFTGFRNDIEKIFKITDLTVQCTDNNHKEGVSNVIMESLAMGVPVIATNAGGTPEIIEDGVNGYLVEIGDYVSLARNIEKIINDKNLRDAFSIQARKTIEEKFSIKKMVDGYISVYNEAMK